MGCMRILNRLDEACAILAVNGQIYNASPEPISLTVSKNTVSVLIQSLDRLIQVSFSVAFF